jgi:hypothetical protein
MRKILGLNMIELRYNKACHFYQISKCPFTKDIYHDCFKGKPIRCFGCGNCFGYNDNKDMFKLWKDGGHELIYEKRET